MVHPWGMSSRSERAARHPDRWREALQDARRERLGRRSSSVFDPGPYVIEPSVWFELLGVPDRFDSIEDVEAFLNG